jgi:signal transduction histidine kinase/ActR/RegA family two-component response regulator
MGHVHDARTSSQQRSTSESGSVQSEARGPMQLQLTALQDEVAALRQVAGEKAALEATLAQLREANQNLVLATVSAQTGRDDAEEANRRQTEFLAMLAHELRNPLAPIGMAAALIARTQGATPQLLDLAQVIGRQVAHMSHLLDDLLDAARISSGTVTLSLEPVLLSEVVALAVETLASRMRERDQQFSVSLPDQAVVLHGDKVRLVQVFTNLLANASKYTDNGGSIHLAATLSGDQVQLTFQDNGSGIPPDLLPHIFDLFTQGPRSLARSEGGLGVGLNVVRNLVEMHGGRVDAASPGAGLGSTFSVTLPVTDATPAARKAPSSTSAAARGLKLLLIEDNVDACDTLGHLLAMEGHEVRSAHDGKSGLAAAIAGGYDVLICDIGLPGIDGLELIASLRRAPNGQRPYAIALSGYCQSEDRLRALDAGFDHYCVKPASADFLLGLLASAPCQRRRS